MLVNINPPLRPGQTVVCSACGRMTNNAKAETTQPFGFYCNSPACQAQAPSQEAHHVSPDSR